ncbi:fructose-2,6-bisphosphatase TIGAR isoform X2 [Manacus candei]|uniref:fructose-2,6-bisphosphatase TIGAR isoform X2 n=1 Tax=Manacus candei TaxID=415023 RepID=UPI002225F274|nr:fructose-2,6-bisphosphatase TIGAR isoform X2 [Manacus candei]
MVRFGLTVVRHGETRYNKDKILQGQGVDEPLSATGFRQADAAGVFLSNVKFTHVFSSDLLRAKQTATAILGKNKFCRDLEIKYDARLRERKYGVAEGRPLADLKAMAKDAGEQCPSFTPSGGETLDEVRERARDFFEFLCQLAVGLEQKDPGGSSRSSGTPKEQFVFPWTDHCSEGEASSEGSGSSKILDANILVLQNSTHKNEQTRNSKPLPWDTPSVPKETVSWDSKIMLWHLEQSDDLPDSEGK